MEIGQYLTRFWNERLTDLFPNFANEKLCLTSGESFLLIPYDLLFFPSRFLRYPHRNQMYLAGRVLNWKLDANDKSPTLTIRINRALDRVKLRWRKITDLSSQSVPDSAQSHPSRGSPP